MNAAVSIDEKAVKKTRKDHQCCECGRVIPKGSACMVAHGLWQDGPETYRWCLACHLVRVEVLTLIDDVREFCYGQLWDWVEGMN